MAHICWAFHLALISAIAIGTSMCAAKSPLSLHPDNGHYFLFRGKATVLVTSGEHYGAVLNLDFDYRKYLDTLSADGLNNTRTFSGAYVEPPGAFKIARNTLAPDEGRFICPWARSDEPGYACGGAKFDLSRFDTTYFERLRDFLAHAGRNGVVVEMNLFCPMYDDKQWNLSPMHRQNNIQRVGPQDRTHVYTLDRHAGLLEVQERMVRKIVEELNEFDNLYYEICNEPYFGGVALEWQRHVADVIAKAEEGLPHKHVISQNIANGSAKIENPNSQVSIFNFHYAAPPDAVAANYHLNKVIGDNETGFRGTGDAVYRMEGWDFIVAGGGLFNHLDYSFAVGHEDGTFRYPSSQPGGGSAALRRQLKVLSNFIHSFEFVKMKPDNSVIKAGVPRGVSARSLVEPGRAYAIYIRPAPGVKDSGTVTQLTVELPRGNYRAEWLNVLDGSVARTEQFEHAGGNKPLAAPRYQDDIALRIVAVE